MYQSMIIRDVRKDSNQDEQSFTAILHWSDLYFDSEYANNEPGTVIKFTNLLHDDDMFADIEHSVTEITERGWRIQR